MRNQSFYPKQSSTSTAEFLIHTTFKNGDLIILGGCVTKGILKKHQYMYLGPDAEGHFKYIFDYQGKYRWQLFSAAKLMWLRSDSAKLAVSASNAGNLIKNGSRK